MNIKELKAKITEKIQSFKELTAALRKEYSESSSKIGFIKTTFNREIMDKKERIPCAIITAWILVLMIFSYSWTFGMNWSTVFNFGVLPIIVYYIWRSVRESPTS